MYKDVSFIPLQIFGCVVIGVGASTLVDFGYYVALSSLLPYATATKVSIAAGILMTAVVFLGCWGAWKENRFLLIIVSDYSKLRNSHITRL